MASKSGQQEPEKAEVIEALLDDLDTALDRVKVLYEQYFLGIQKQPPTYLHTDVERKIRDLAQIQIRNTALRYRFATLQQKFGSYHSYWRRTLRQIENGTYTRSLSKIGRQAVKTGAAVPEEILAAMPRRMRDQVVRDREAALALARLRERQRHGAELPTLDDEDVDIDVGDLGAGDLGPAGFPREPTDVRASAPRAGSAHRIDESDAGFDVDAFFTSVIHEDPSPPLESRHEAAGPGTTAPSPAAAIPASTRPSSSGMSAAMGRASTDGGSSTTETAQPRRTTGQMRAVALRAKTDDGASAEAAQSAGVTGQPRTATARASSDAGPSGGAGLRTEMRSSSSGMAAPDAARGAGQSALGAPAQGRQARPPPIPPRVPAATGGERPAQSFPRAPSPVPARPEPPRPATPAPSQATRPLRVAPGAAADHASAPVETLAGPFPRIPGPSSLDPSRASPAASAVAPSVDRPPAPSQSSAGEPRQQLPPGMSHADVNALYAQYVRAKRRLGEDAEPGTYGKLLKTITTQAPKIMEQYKSRGVDFSVVVKDNQVIIRAKPKP